MTDNKFKQKASETLVDKGIVFFVEYKGQKLEFSMKKLVLETLIKISGERARLINYTSQTKSLEVIQSMGHNAPILARCIAISVINSQPIPEKLKRKKELFKFWKKEELDTKYMNEDQMTEVFCKSLNSKELSQLTKVIVDQMDSDYFFAATISIGGIDLLKPMSEMDIDQLTQSKDE